jgi:hypothetical protein
MHTTPQTLLAGAAAGCVATVPMTLVMEALHRTLPREEEAPLPPRQITSRAADAVGIEDDLSERQKRQLTLVAHYGYGTAAGAVYGALAPHVPLPPVVRGVAFGLTVWAGSYLGLLPATGLLHSATRERAERNALMIAAHIVWGGVLGVLAEEPNRARVGT